MYKRKEIAEAEFFRLVGSAPSSDALAVMGDMTELEVNVMSAIVESTIALIKDERPREDVLRHLLGAAIRAETIWPGIGILCSVGDAEEVCDVLYYIAHNQKK